MDGHCNSQDARNTRLKLQQTVSETGILPLATHLLGGTITYPETVRLMASLTVPVGPLGMLRFRARKPNGHRGRTYCTAEIDRTIGHPMAPKPLIILASLMRVTLTDGDVALAGCQITRLSGRDELPIADNDGICSAQKRSRMT